MAGASPDRARPRLAVVALGCRTNQAEADALAASLAGACALAEPADADVVVVNTCTVTADAARAARQAIRRAARENPGAKILAAGCHAEVCREELAGLPGVTAVVGARSALALEGAVRHALATATATATTTPTATATATATATPTSTAAPLLRARPILKVQDGCSARCSYCVVPLARGPGRSLPQGEALRRLRALGERSAEVVLAGVHLGAYGRDRGTSLGALLEAAAEARVAHRLRLSSVEPHELPHAALEGAAGALVCEHLHLPAQSGSDAVLAAMRRGYRASTLARAVERLARARPGAAIGLDLLAGFPGETDADHRASVALAESLPVAYLHVFPFSPRPGTDAARLAPLPREVVRARAAELRAVSERRWRAFLDGLAGRTLECVVERVEDGAAHGTSREFAAVRWPAAGGERRGAVTHVAITAREGGVLAGEAAAR